MSRILYRGGNIYSTYPAQTSSTGATAMLVDGSQVAWVGSDAAATGLGEPDTIVELDGAWVAPAFVDAHVHVLAAGLALTVLDLSESTSLSDVLGRVARASARLPAGSLVWATGWDETRWVIGSPRRGPTPQELDRAASGRPVYLARTDVHSASASSDLLRAAGLAVVDPPVTGADHHALRSAARRLLTPQQRRDAAEAFFTAAVAQGIGMVHDCSGPDIGDDAELATVRLAAEAAGVELVSYWGEAGAAGVSRARRLGAQPGGDIFVDGSIGSRTAALLERYLDYEGRGELLLDPEAIADHLIVATRAGAQAGFHAIGDAAVSAVAHGLELAAAAVGPGLLAAGRHRVEHLEMSSAQLWPVLARFGVIASVQPSFDARWGGPESLYAERLGTDRAASMNDFAGMAASGIPLAFGSDAPVTPLDPWGSLRAATTTHNPRHSLSARAAFAAHTRGGHRAARRDGGGILAPGADATFAIWNETGPLTVGVPDGRVAAWSTDPRAGAPGMPDLSADSSSGSSHRPRCAGTVVAGRLIYDGDLIEAKPLQSRLKRSTSP